MICCWMTMRTHGHDQLCRECPSGKRQMTSIRLTFGDKLSEESRLQSILWNSRILDWINSLKRGEKKNMNFSTFKSDWFQQTLLKGRKSISVCISFLFHSFQIPSCFLAQSILSSFVVLGFLHSSKRLIWVAMGKANHLKLTLHGFTVLIAFRGGMNPFSWNVYGCQCEKRLKTLFKAFGDFFLVNFGFDEL